MTIIEKQHIKCLFISKSPHVQATYDIGLLTDSFEYFDFDIATKNLLLTPNLWLNLHEMFRPFKFSVDTDVMLTNNIENTDNISLWIRTLQDGLNFQIKYIDKLRIPKRISTMHKRYVPKAASKITMTDMQMLWNKIIKYNKCPWITHSIDLDLLSCGQTYYKRKQFNRMALYYMLIKKHLYNKYKNSRGYREKHTKTISV